MCIQSSSDSLKATWGRMKSNTYNQSAIVGERGGIKREVKRRGGETCSEDKRTKKEGPLSRKEGRGHILHTCLSSTNESMFSNCTGNLPLSIS